MADNRVVIKINYDTDKRKEVLDPRLVTVWHTRRILAALLALVLIIMLSFWLLSGDGQETEVQSESVSKPEMSGENNQEIQSSAVSVQTASSAIKKLVLDKGSAIIFDKLVIRASLNTSIKDNEPEHALQTAVIIEPGKSQELFYFSETKSAKSAALFHHWLKDGQLMVKKQVEKKKTKFVSRHIVGQKDIGHWKVVLIDKKGKIYSQVEFNIGLQ